MRVRSLKYAASAASILLVAGMAQAQSFNIDIGTGFGIPASTFGAGANQPGVWNEKATSGPSSLVDLAGNPTNVTIAPTNAWLGFSFNNGTTSGDHQALMDDISDGLQSFTIAGLAAGTYEVYTYAWAPDVPGQAITNVAVNLSAPTATGQSTVGPPPYATTGHYALHTVTLAAGENIFVDLTQSVSFVSCNGIQIKAVGGGKCPEDLNGDGQVNVSDLVSVILGWGTPSGDVNGSGTTDVSDLVAVILAWGPC